MAAFRGYPVMEEPATSDLPVITVSSVEFPQAIFSAMRTGEGAAKLRKAFAAEPPTFGTAFMQAVLSDSRAEALLTLLGQRSEELEKLPRARQLRIASLYRIAADDATKLKGNGDLIVKGRAWMHQVEESAALAGMECVRTGVRTTGAQYPDAAAPDDARRGAGLFYPDAGAGGRRPRGSH
jgi:hypothetical protein